MIYHDVGGSTIPQARWTLIHVLSIVFTAAKAYRHYRWGKFYRIIGYTIATIKFQFISNDVVNFIILYISTHNIIQLVNFPSQCIVSISVTKGQYGRFTRILFARDATVVDAQGIIAWFLDLVDLVQIHVVPQERRFVVNPNKGKQRGIPEKNLWDSPIPRRIQVGIKGK